MQLIERLKLNQHVSTLGHQLQTVFRKLVACTIDSDVEIIYKQIYQIIS